MTIGKVFKPVAVKPKRFKVMIGGRGSGKSLTVADLLLLKVQTEQAKVGCFREFQNSLAESSYALFRDEIERLGIDGFTFTKTEIRHKDGGLITFHGLSRSIDTVKSMHGYNYFYVEEAQFLSKNSINILIPTVREEGSELWFTGNPGSSADPFSKRFITPYLTDLKRNSYFEDDSHIVVFINYDVNPWFPEVLEQDRLRDFKELDRALYDHIWQGAFNDYVEDSIVKAQWFDACVDAHEKLGFKPRGQRVVSHDPSDLGIDDKSLVDRYGSIVLHAELRKFGDVNEGCDWALSYAVQSRADVFAWDGDGMGVSLRRQVRKALKGKRIQPEMFRGSNEPDYPDRLYEDPSKLDKKNRLSNKHTFRNKRAQYYWYLRDRIYNTYQAVEKNVYSNPDQLLSFSSKIPDLQQLRSEICRIPRKPNPNGLIQIMTKQEMKRLLKIESPNLADAVMMSLIMPEPLQSESAPTEEPEMEAAY